MVKEVDFVSLFQEKGKVRTLDMVVVYSCTKFVHTFNVCSLTSTKASRKIFVKEC